MEEGGPEPLGQRAVELHLRVDGAVAVVRAPAQVTIGRDPNCDLVVDDPRVSRRHATVHVDDSGGWFEDHSSRGSFLPDGSTITRLSFEQAQVHLADRAGPLLEMRFDRPALPTALRVRAENAELLVGRDDTVRIGRDPGCDLVVADDPRVGRSHLELRSDAGRWLAADLGSANGTWLRGRRVGVVEVDPTAPLVLGGPDGVEVWCELVVAGGSSGAGVAIRQSHAAPTPQDPILTGSVLAGSVFAGEVTRIGRAPDNDLVIADDLTVSRHHAEIAREAGGTFIVDLGSRGGTFVDGVAVSRAPLRDGSLIGIGRGIFVLREDMLDHFVEERVTLVADKVVVSVGDRRLVDEVSLPVEPGHLIGIVGPSGAGKTSLLRVLTGSLPATSGTVSYNGRNLHRSMSELRRRIGFVPQDDLVHVTLGVREALTFAAELRFATDTTAAERAARVERVMEELGLAERADARIDSLSGGQRKRVSVAFELLTEPALLFLDEPTSGLDPGYERSVMQVLRDLADGGRSVVVVTHALASLTLCDQVLFLAPGGRTAYFGPPDRALDWFEASDWADVFVQLEREPDRAAREFAASTQYEDNVGAPMRRLGATASVPPMRPVIDAATPGRWAQCRTLMRRGQSVMSSSPASFWLLVAQAPVIALLLVASLGRDNLTIDLARHRLGTQARVLVLVLVVSSIAMALINSCREIVKELPIYRRERTVGLSLGAYLGSKFALLGVVALGETAVLEVVVIVEGARRPVLMFVMLVLVAFASTSLGLLVSALSPSETAAVVLVPVVIVAQLILSGGVLDVSEKPVLRQIAWIMPASWGYDAVASSTDMVDHDQICDSRRQLRQYPDIKVLVSQLGGQCSPKWEPTLANQARGAAGLVVLSIGYSAAAAWAMRRRDPLRAIRS